MHWNRPTSPTERNTLIATGKGKEQGRAITGGRPLEIRLVQMMPSKKKALAAREHAGGELAKQRGSTCGG